MGFFFEQGVLWLLQIVLNTFLTLLSIIEKGLLVSPDVTALPQVQALTGKSTRMRSTLTRFTSSQTTMDCWYP